MVDGPGKWTDDNSKTEVYLLIAMVTSGEAGVISDSQEKAITTVKYFLMPSECFIFCFPRFCFIIEHLDHCKSLICLGMESPSGFADGRPAHSHSTMTGSISPLVS